MHSVCGTDKSVPCEFACRYYIVGEAFRLPQNVTPLYEKWFVPKGTALRAVPPLQSQPIYGKIAVIFQERLQPLC